MKIYLSPSDQMNNSYAYGNTVEGKQCRRIAEFCKTALIRNGFEVRLDEASMEENVQYSNSWGADIHICIHTNAYNGKVMGTRAFSYDTTGQGYKVTNCIYKWVRAISPGNSESLTARPGLYEIRKTKAKCAYIECEFHDTVEGAKWIIEHAEDIGEAICRGVCEYAGKTYVPKKIESKTLYRVQVGAYAVKSNAEEMLKKLKSAGFEGFIV